MSVQLVIRPQNYNGQFNVFSTNPDEYLVDGISFTSLNTSSTYEASSGLNLMQNAPPSIVNSWYRFRSTTPASPNFPLQIGTDLVFNSLATLNQSAVYQRLSGLTIGQSYTMTVNVETISPSGVLSFSTWSGNTQLTSTVINTIGATQTHTFTAVTTTDTILIAYTNNASISIVIPNISIVPTGQIPSGTDNELSDGQVICDLYEDEDIPLTLSVDDFKNVAESVQSYSKAFNLPATKRNNKIFDNIFEITRTDDGVVFNPYRKTQCILKQDGIVLFEGYLRLIDISDKEGEISYNVNLYSEVVALADVLGDRTFAELDFSELTHAYDIDNIKYSWNTTGTGVQYTLPNASGFRDDYLTLKYPFCDWDHQVSVDGNGMPVLAALETAFRPFIQIKYIIDRIFNQSGLPFSYTSSFFDSAEFSGLYMDFNWGGDSNPNVQEANGLATSKSDASTNYATTSWSTVLFPSTDSMPDIMGWNSSTSIFTVPAGLNNSNISIMYNASFIAKKDCTVEFRWVKNEGLASEQVKDYSGVINADGSAIVIPTYSVFSVVPTTYDLDANLLVVEGGDYSGTPTATLNVFGGNPNLTATLTGTEVTSVSNSSFALYSIFNDDRVELNGKNPFVTYSGWVPFNVNAGDTIKMQFQASAINSIRQNDLSDYNKFGSPITRTRSTISAGITVSAMTSDVLLQSLRGETGQWDFLKGIMTMFNLVAIPNKDNPNNILIEPYNEVFVNNTNCAATGEVSLACRSISHDWTEKIDISQIKLEPLTDLNKKTVFKFVEDDDDYAFNVYKSSVQGFLYGSKVFDASGFNVLDGSDEIIAEPFAATVPKPYMTQYPELIVPAIYTYNADDGVSESFENSPRIMFNNGVKTLSSTTYAIPAQNNGSAIAAENQFLQFSHLTDIPTVVSNPPEDDDTNDFHFGECQLITPIGQAVPNNLFNTYWLPYYNELYNPDTRIMTLKVNLNSGDISTFNMYDTVFIKNREFRVNKIDYKPNDLATVEFILIP